MHALHIQIDAELSLSGLQSPPIKAPVITIPISDPIGLMLENELQALPDRANDGNPEVIAHGKTKLAAFKLFGTKINVAADYEFDAEFWITSDDDAVQAQAAAMSTNNPNASAQASATPGGKPVTP